MLSGHSSRFRSIDNCGNVYRCFVRKQIRISSQAVASQPYLQHPVVGQCRLSHCKIKAKKEEMLEFLLFFIWGAGNEAGKTQRFWWVSRLYFCHVAKGIWNTSWLAQHHKENFVSCTRQEFLNLKNKIFLNV